MSRFAESGPGLMILDEHGEPKPAASLAEWAEFFEDDARRSVAFTELVDADGKPVIVSTIFLGIASPFSLRGPIPAPLWETMILGGPRHGSGERSRTRLDALAAHERFVSIALTPPEE